MLKNSILASFKTVSIELSEAWKTIPEFSANNNFSVSFSFKAERSSSAPKLISAKHISNKVVINPPEATS